jgi:hypothetical protein
MDYSKITAKNRELILDGLFFNLKTIKLLFINVS